jgi:isopenicillin N synthase-like dioxygenase
MSVAPPLINVAGLRSPKLSDRLAVAGAIGNACRGIGFFYVLGHALDTTLMDATFDATRRFFALPLSIKRALARDRVGDNRGFVDLEEERLDLNSNPDRKEAFNIGLELPASHPGRARRHLGENAWPDLPGWRELMLNYYGRCLELGRLLHHAFSLDLGIAEDFFDSRLDCPMATLRLLHYPARVQDDAGMGAGAHTDYGNLTLLIVNGVSGLQIRPRNGGWIDAPHIPGAFICNIGDCLMRWSNDIYVSTPHRVLSPVQERYSIAFFLDPNADAVVKPIIGQSSMVPKYPPITGAAFLESRLNPTYAK